jgi:hypothetical protein
MLVFVGTTYFALQGGGFAGLNIVIVTGWLVPAFFFGLEYSRLTRTGGQPGPTLVGSRGDNNDLADIWEWSDAGQLWSTSRTRRTTWASTTLSTR